MPCPLPCTMGSHRIFISYQNPRVGGRNSCPVILPSVKPGATPACTCGSQFLCTICGVSIFWHHVIGTYHSAWKRDDTDGQCPALRGGGGGGQERRYIRSEADLRAADLSALARWIFSEYLSAGNLSYSLINCTPPAGLYPGLNSNVWRTVRTAVAHLLFSKNSLLPNSCL